MFLSAMFQKMRKSIFSSVFFDFAKKERMKYRLVCMQVWLSGCVCQYGGVSTVRHVGHVSGGPDRAYKWHDKDRSYEHQSIHSLSLSIIAAGNHKDISF